MYHKEIIRALYCTVQCFSSIMISYIIKYSYVKNLTTFLFLIHTHETPGVPLMFVS